MLGCKGKTEIFGTVPMEHANIYRNITKEDLNHYLIVPASWREENMFNGTFFGMSRLLCQISLVEHIKSYNPKFASL